MDRCTPSGSGTMRRTNEETFPTEEHQGTNKELEHGEYGDDILVQKPRMEDEDDYEELEDLAEYR
ncbi:hypothetical protein EJB05_17262, partial [Eragrostis curvula]